KVDGLVGAFDNSDWSPGAITKAFYVGLFAYSGWNYLNCMIEEMNNPRRDLPLAIIISCLLVTFIYTMANVAYVTVVSPYEILTTPAVAITFSVRIYGVMWWIMPIFVALSTFGGVNGTVMTTSRMFFVASQVNQMPKLLCFLHMDRLTPISAVVFTLKTSTSEGKHGIQWTSRMHLDDLDFADGLALLSHTQQQIHKETTSVAAASAAVGLNIHEGKSKILRYGTACINPITIDGEDLEDVKTFTYLGSVIDEHGESDSDMGARINKARAAYLQLKSIWNSKQQSVNQRRSWNFQYIYPDSSTVWGGNWQNYESNHPEVTAIY
ncbi:unnamed protein product, partial [Schistosoma mattheei]